MKLYLMQHGEAESKEVDPQRPLSAKGIQDVSKVSSFIKNNGINIDEIVHSGKLRAQQTADILSGLIANVIPSVHDGINPNDDVTIFSDDVDNFEHDLCVVGHLPFMSKLVTYLTTGEIDLSLVDYSPGTLVCLQRDDNDQWQFEWMIRPALIAD